MDSIQEWIAAFNLIAPDEHGQCPDKHRIVEELRDHLADERVLNFYIQVITDKNEFDLARLAACKTLKLWHPPTNEIRIRVGQQLARMLPLEEDVLIQQWAAIAAENFINVKEVFDAVVALLVDPNADLDVRHNCLSAVERLRGTDRAEQILRSLVDDEQLGVHIRRILADWKDIHE